jgi:hypothetical protein
LHLGRRRPDAAYICNCHIAIQLSHGRDPPSGEASYLGTDLAFTASCRCGLEVSERTIPRWVQLHRHDIGWSFSTRVKTPRSLHAIVALVKTVPRQVYAEFGCTGRVGRARSVPRQSSFAKSGRTSGRTRQCPFVFFGRMQEPAIHLSRCGETSLSFPSALVREIGSAGPIFNALEF